MPRRESIILYGEGKTEAVFLRHLCCLYQRDITARVKTSAGQGGSPKQIATRLIKELSLASYDRSLLLIDEDLPTSDIPRSWLSKHRITLVCSTPRCLEGLLLTLLNDPPPARQRHQSERWKRHFHKNHLKTDRRAEIVSKLAKHCPSLFPRKLIDSRRDTCPPLAEILNFLIPS